MSGDRYAADVVRELRAAGGVWRVEGFGGPRLAEAGVRLRADLSELAVMGIVEVVRRLGFFVRLLRATRRSWEEDPPDAVLFVDYPGLNLRLARHARRLGLRTLYYITPTVWAWNERRVGALRANVDELLVILPFEEAFFAARGLRARFVGHPLGREARRPRHRAAFLRELGLDPAADVLGLLPGSRTQELRSLAAPFLAAAERLRAVFPRPLQLAFAVATPELAAELRRRVGDLVPIAVGGSADLIAASTAVLTKSGTATVEAALLGTPMVVAYRMNPLTLWLARRLVKVEWFAMVNILRGKAVVPELLQREASPAEIARQALPLLDRTNPARMRMVAEFDALREDLLRRDAPAEVARAVRDAVSSARRAR
ncbi:MAG: lipid-A-disaccharide synthase [Gemmatimonadetes bacterium]|nr:lipid-A-disaccharide synthase [Gemmatimonadota bacterium]